MEQVTLTNPELDQLYEWLVKLPAGVWRPVSAKASVGIRTLIDEGHRTFTDVVLSDDFTQVFKKPEHSKFEQQPKLRKL